MVLLLLCFSDFFFFLSVYVCVCVLFFFLFLRVNLTIIKPKYGFEKVNAISEYEQGPPNGTVHFGRGGPPKRSCHSVSSPQFRRQQDAKSRRWRYLPDSAFSFLLSLSMTLSFLSLLSVPSSHGWVVIMITALKTEPVPLLTVVEADLTEHGRAVVRSRHPSRLSSDTPRGSSQRTAPKKK